MKKYNLRIHLDEFRIINLVLSFKSEDDLKESIENYIDGEDSMVEVLSSDGKIVLHRYVCELNDNNEFILLDECMNFN